MEEILEKIVKRIEKIMDNKHKKADYEEEDDDEEEDEHHSHQKGLIFITILLVLEVLGLNMRLILTEKKHSVQSLM